MRTDEAPCISCGTYGGDHDPGCPVGDSVLVQYDTASSASRQHYIDTGRYLTSDESEGAL